VTFEQFTELLRPDMAEVDRVIRERLYSEVVLVRQVAEYIISGGGKRLRPALVVLCAKALGYHGTYHHELAATVEFIHTATLLHDDVVDESALRRGRDTANAVFGNPASVLVGDFLYSRAFQMMVSVHSMKVMEILSEATNVIAEGEVLQLMNCHDPDIDEEAYLRVIRYKTAKLFEASGRLGAVIAEAGDTIESALGHYGIENIGDNGGLQVAYHAYTLSRDGAPAADIDGITGDQRFFLGWAQVWRALIRDAALRNQVLTDPHSPALYRTNGTVRNMDTWYAAFNVQPGDALYLAPEDRVTIW
jgi:hypothetical protein